MRTTGASRAARPTMRTTSRAAAAAVALAAAALGLSGCSQVDSLAAVSGDKPATVRSAAIDVLLAENVAILTAPVCTQPDKTSITCTGSTATKEPISVTSTATVPLMMKVVVGSRTLYEGDAQTVLDEAATRGETP